MHDTQKEVDRRGILWKSKKELYSFLNRRMYTISSEMATPFRDISIVSILLKSLL